MLIEIIVVALGLLVGLSLGALGGGGSTLAVPILVFVAGLPAQDATTAALVVVGIASAFGVIGHYRNGSVRLGAGVAFGAAGIVGANLGTQLNRSLDENVLLLLFSALIAFVAFRMFRKSEAPMVEPDEPAPSQPEGDQTPGSIATLAPADTVTETRSNTTTLNPKTLLPLALAATVVGLLTGLFGVGGGFAVVPALVLALGYSTKEAIGTSLVVITINATTALSLRADELDLDWSIVLPFLVTVVIGVAIGTVIANRVPAERLTRSFAVMLGVVAIYTAAATLLA